MKYVPLIVEQFQACAAERILLVDDAYDAPDFADELAGELFEFLESADFRTKVTTDVVDDPTKDEAIASLSAGELDHESVQDAFAAMYSTWLVDRDEKFDPRGRFAETKSSALEKLDGLTELLRRCEGLSIAFAGARNAEKVFDLTRPHVLFMDYYLSPSDRAAGPENADEKQDDEQRSIQLVKRLLVRAGDDRPSVVLMSSEDLEEQAGRYRTELAGDVLALRFAFLHKTEIAGRGKKLAVDDRAADVLLDTAQAFEFGRELENSLRIWRRGAEKALETLERELKDLDVKDFAYLLRFRLKAEGESFANYLEWFLGESLRGAVDEEVEWDDRSFERVDDPTVYQAIEGGHPEPTDRIARMFHRIRFSMPNKRSKRHFSLGDVFVEPDGNKVRMVLSPDCDLIPRDNGRTGAERLLTLGGELKGMDKDAAFAADLVMHGEVAKVIDWSMKDIAAHPIGEDLAIEVDDVAYERFGTLRPLHAQDIQKLALADLGRVGVAVAPTVYSLVKVSVKVRKKDSRLHSVAGDELAEHPATVIFARGGAEGEHRVMFDRSYVRTLQVALRALDKDSMHDRAARGFLKKFVNDTATVTKKMQQDGLVINGEGIFGATVVKNKPDKGGPWLQFIVHIDEVARS